MELHVSAFCDFNEFVKGSEQMRTAKKGIGH